MRIFTFIFLLLSSIFTLFTTPILAQTTIGGYTISPPPSLRPEFSQPGALGFIVSEIYILVLQIVGIVGFLFFLWAGFQYLTSKGDPKAIQAAHARLTYSAIGVIIIALAYAISLLVFNVMGVRLP